MNASRTLALSLLSLMVLGCEGADGQDGDTGPNGATGSDGQDGTSVLVSTTVEPDGANCATGGIKLETGADTNDDGVLDADEVTSTQYICNGDAGADGSDGNDGLQSLVDTTQLPPNGACFFGGVQIDYGIDDDSNGFLTMTEIDGTELVCAACPFDTAVITKDFAALGDSSTALLDLGEVQITATPGDVNVAGATSLGVTGGTPLIDSGEALTFDFLQPVFNLNYSVGATGATGGHQIEAFGTDDASLGTIDASGTGDKAISGLLGDVAITSFVDTANADLHNITTMEFTLCP